MFTGSEVIRGNSMTLQNVPILGFYQTPSESGGRVVVFGDSNCLDSAHLHRGINTCGHHVMSLHCQ